MASHQYSDRVKNWTSGFRRDVKACESRNAAPVFYDLLDAFTKKYELGESFSKPLRKLVDKKIAELSG